MARVFRKIQDGSAFITKEMADASTDSFATVGATTTEVLAANGDRIEAILCNDSDEVMYLGFGNDAVLNKGTRLNRRGGTIIIVAFTGVVNAICASGSKNLCYSELS